MTKACRRNSAKTPLLNTGFPELRSAAFPFLNPGGNDPAFYTDMQILKSRTLKKAPRPLQNPRRGAADRFS